MKLSKYPWHLVCEYDAEVFNKFAMTLMRLKVVGFMKMDYQRAVEYFAFEGICQTSMFVGVVVNVGEKYEEYELVDYVLNENDAKYD